MSKNIIKVDIYFTKCVSAQHLSWLEKHDFSNNKKMLKESDYQYKMLFHMKITDDIIINFLPDMLANIQILDDSGSKLDGIKPGNYVVHIEIPDVIKTTFTTYITQSKKMFLLDLCYISVNDKYKQHVDSIQIKSLTCNVCSFMFAVEDYSDFTKWKEDLRLTINQTNKSVEDMELHKLVTDRSELKLFNIRTDNNCHTNQGIPLELLFILSGVINTDTETLESAAVEWDDYMYKRLRYYGSNVINENLLLTDVPSHSFSGVTKTKDLFSYSIVNTFNELMLEFNIEFEYQSKLAIISVTGVYLDTIARCIIGPYRINSIDDPNGNIEISIKEKFDLDMFLTDMLMSNMLDL